MVPGIKPHRNAINLEREDLYPEALALKSETDVYRAEEDAGLSATQWQALSMLLAGKKQLDVATALGITQSTVSRWRHSPVFAAALNIAVRDCYISAVAELRDASTDALLVLRECMQSNDPRVRVTAAVAILRLRLKLDASVLQLPTSPADIACESLRRRSSNDLDDMLIDL